MKDWLRGAVIAIAALRTFGLLASVSPAAAAGPIVATEGTQPGGLAGGEPPADVASKCNSCHAGGIDDDGKTFRPWDTWSGTMMAQAMRDPLFLASLTVAEQDIPGAGAYCIRCHTPKGFVKGHATGIGNALDADDNQGVDCEACHRSINGAITQPTLDHEGMAIASLPPVDLMAPYLGNARLIWDPRDVRHGPHSDADSPAHAAGGSSFGSSSEMCGQCHELQSPSRNLLDANGRDTGLPFPLDTTYTEWRSSDFANGPMDMRRSCIDCHMPRARGEGLTVATHPAAMPRTNPRMHLFVGGNEWALDAVQFAAPELAVERSAAFTAAKQATQVMLASALQVDITPGPAQAGATTLEVTVRVTNLSGHKFPTGYADGRRAFLQVELQDGGGRSLAVLGKYDEAAQRLDAAATRIWEAIHAERTSTGGHHEWHIVKNDMVVEDTRIPPKGFRPMGNAVTLTAPVGADFGPPTGMRNHDDVKVQFSSLAPLPTSGLKVTARVFYQSTMREFIEELERANTTDDRGRKLRAIWEGTGRAAPRMIQSKTTDVNVGPPAPAVDGGGDAGGTGGNAGTGGAGPDAGGSTDGGTRPPPVAPSGGCQCATANAGDAGRGGESAGGPGNLASLAFLTFLLGLATWWRRRRSGARL